MKKTIENLAKAFIGESQARSRYSMYASIAKAEGYEQVAGIFLETADQEKEHAKQIYKMLMNIKEGEGMDLTHVTVQADAPLTYGSTSENLRAAIMGEHHETSIMYPGMAEDAETEGYKDIGARLRKIAVAESHHEQRYSKLLHLVENKSYFKRRTAVWWTCRECGYVHYGEEPPKECPACSHASSFYQLLNEEY